VRWTCVDLMDVLLPSLVHKEIQTPIRSRYQITAVTVSGGGRSFMASSLRRVASMSRQLEFTRETPR
jgi:hypothetical protein